MNRCRVRRGRRFGSVAICVSMSFTTVGACTADDPEPPPLPQERYIVAAVGDISCGGPSGDPANAHGSCRDDIVADVVAAIDPDRLLLLGDIQYPSERGAVSYERHFDRSFGRFRSISAPTPGDAEWEDHADEYFRYFGDAAGPPDGYYSFELGAWHVLSLNSPDCFDADGCGEGTPQFEWLRSDLAAHPSDRYPCTLAFWHDPRFVWVSWWQKDGKPRGPLPHVRPLWDLLEESGAEVVLGGNAHNYERWLPQDVAGFPNPEGLTQFVVGTGGRRLNDAGPEPRPAQLAAFQDDAFGALELTLGPGAYSWAWRSAAGEPAYTDQGSGRCS
jgi:acid phosphatase type 7